MERTRPHVELRSELPDWMSKLLILRYNAPINGTFWCVYNWQNLRKHVYSIGPVTG